MKKLMIVVTLATFVCSAFGEAKGRQSRHPDGSFAGMVVQPGSQKGIFSFVNTQNLLDRAEIENVAKQAAEALQIKVIVSEAQPASPETLLKASDGALAVIVVADETTPTMLLAPEDGWGVVNVKRLDKFSTPSAREKFFGARCRRELMRAFAQVAGGTGSEYPGNVCSVTKVEELELAEEGLPIDKITAAQRFLKSRGYAPTRKVPYFKACLEGWAPAPTNDAQRAVWQKIHAIPDKPIKVEYDPAKGE